MRTRIAAAATALALVSASAFAPSSWAAPSAPAAGSIDLCAQVGAAAGFQGDALVTAIAVAMAESSCDPLSRHTNSDGSVDRGLWQINSKAHPDVSDPCAYDAQCNANHAFTISSDGTNWNPWSTYKNGAYTRYLTQARDAAAWASMGPGDLVNGGIDDVSGDGHADLVWSDGHNVEYLGNNSSTNPDGKPFDGTSVAVVNGLPAGALMAVGSVTGHRTADLFIYDPSQDVVKLYVGGGGGAPYAGNGVQAASGLGAGVTRIFAADLTGDGFDELVWTKSDGTVWYLPNNMGSTADHSPFGDEHATLIASGLPTDGSKVTFGDITGDHFADLLYISDGDLYYLPNNIVSHGGVQPFIPEDPIQLSTNGGFATVRQMTAADVSGDGVADLLWTDDGGNVMYLPNSFSTNPGGAFFYGDSLNVAHGVSTLI